MISLEKKNAIYWYETMMIIDEDDSREADTRRVKNKTRLEAHGGKNTHPYGRDEKLLEWRRDLPCRRHKAGYGKFLAPYPDWDDEHQSPKWRVREKADKSFRQKVYTKPGSPRPRAATCKPRKQRIDKGAQLQDALQEIRALWSDIYDEALACLKYLEYRRFPKGVRKAHRKERALLERSVLELAANICVVRCARFSYKNEVPYIICVKKTEYEALKDCLTAVVGGCYQHDIVALHLPKLATLTYRTRARRP
jgi:hypothetical protein